MKWIPLASLLVNVVLLVVNVVLAVRHVRLRRTVRDYAGIFFAAARKNGVPPLRVLGDNERPRL
jgi:hypothetical protein